jgi:ABC-type dipeptide/oligopeptide/nickel transport system permease subunit
MPLEPERRIWGGRAVGRRLLRHRSGSIGISILVLLAMFSILGPFLLPYSPVKQQLGDSLLPPSTHHWLGTDPLGRDILTRLAYGGRYSLSIGVFAVGVGLLIGVPVGAVSGYWGGWIDLLIQRVTDAVLAFPGILLALALVAGLGVGIVNVVIAVGISSVPGFIRLVRASVLASRELTYVEAARALGVSDLIILWRHVLPNAIPPTVVQATTQLGAAILVAAGLGFLGLGVPPPTPEWGDMLSEARNYIFRDAGVVAAPGIAIALTVLAFNLVGDALRDALDPRID